MSRHFRRLSARISLKFRSDIHVREKNVQGLKSWALLPKFCRTFQVPERCLGLPNIFLKKWTKRGQEPELPDSERPRGLLLWGLGVPSRPSPGSDPGPVQVPSRVRRAPVQIRHVLCFTAFRTRPSPEVGAIPARPGPILVLTVPSRIGPGQAETDFLATSDRLGLPPERVLLVATLRLLFWPSDINSVQTSGIERTSEVTRGVCKNRWFYQSLRLF